MKFRESYTSKDDKIKKIESYLTEDDKPLQSQESENCEVREVLLGSFHNDLYLSSELLDFQT